MNHAAAVCRRKRRFAKQQSPGWNVAFGSLLTNSSHPGHVDYPSDRDRESDLPSDHDVPKRRDSRPGLFYAEFRLREKATKRSIQICNQSGCFVPARAYMPKSFSAFRNKGTVTMKKVWLVAVAGLAFSTTNAVARPYYKAPPPPPPACSPVASWTDVNASVCIKYVCAGGGFQIRCLPAPVLR